MNGDFKSAGYAATFLYRWRSGLGLGLVADYLDTKGGQSFERDEHVCRGVGRSIFPVVRLDDQPPMCAVQVEPHDSQRWFRGSASLGLGRYGESYLVEQPRGAVRA